MPVAVSKRFNGLRVAPAQKRRNMVGPFEWILLNEVGSLHDIGWQDEFGLALAL